MKEQRRRLIEHTTAEIGHILAHRSPSPHRSSPPRQRLGGSPIQGEPGTIHPPSGTMHPATTAAYHPQHQQHLPPHMGHPPSMSPEFAGARSGAMQAGLSAMAAARKANELCAQVSKRAPSPRGQRHFLPSPRSAQAGPSYSREASPGPQRPQPAATVAAYSGREQDMGGLWGHQLHQPTLRQPPPGHGHVHGHGEAAATTQALDDRMWAEALANANALVHAQQAAEAERARMGFHAPGLALGGGGCHVQPPNSHGAGFPGAPPLPPGHAPRPSYTAAPNPTVPHEPLGGTPPHRLASSGAGIVSPAGGLVHQGDAALPSWARGDSQASKLSPPQAQGRWAGSSIAGSSRSKPPAGSPGGSPNQGAPRPRYA